LKYTKYFCAKSPFPAKKFLTAGHIANFQTAPNPHHAPFQKINKIYHLFLYGAFAEGTPQRLFKIP